MPISIKLKFHDTLILLLVFLSQYECYEKTLRKIVRNQSKMVPMAFSDNGIGSVRNSLQKNYHSLYPGYTQVNSVIHKMQRSKISTILSSIDTGKSRTVVSRMNIAKNENIQPYELRMARDAITNVIRDSEDNFIYADNQHDTRKNLANYMDAAPEQSKSITIPNSKFFFPSNLSEENDTSLQESSILFPDDAKLEFYSHNMDAEKNVSTVDSNVNINNIEEVPLVNINKTEYEIGPSIRNEADFTLQALSTGQQFQCPNTSKVGYSCFPLNEVTADVDSQKKFEEFDIEPQWVAEKTFWNKIYEIRYESMMRNSKWPPLKVILIPRSDVHSIWKRPFENLHNETVRSIISNAVKKLKFYPNLTFSWNEVSHLAYWWKNTRQKSRTTVCRLVKEGRLEITTGGWVETDESTSSLFGIIHQLTEGHQWLKQHLNYTPEIAWLTQSVSHGPTLPYLLSASGISHLIFTNLHYSWQQYLTEYQFTDFVWVQNWDSAKDTETKLNKAMHKIGKERYLKYSILAHYLQFNSAGFRACGPQGDICDTEFNFANHNNNIDINTFNVKEKSEKVLEQYSKTGTTSLHNVVIAPIGDAFSYKSQVEFDYQYNNYQKISEFVNLNQDIYKATVDFGTAKDYFKSILSKHKTFPTLKGDFSNYADIDSGSPAYWTGYFTTRPLLKILLRRIQSTLRSTEILFAIAQSFKVFQTYNTSNLIVRLINARESVARLQDRNVVSGTLTAKALRYTKAQILSTAKDCWFIQETVISLLSSRPGLNQTYLEKYVYREGEFMSSFKTVTSGDQIYIFNSLFHERREIVELMTRHPNLRVLDYNQKEVAIQVNPVWKYTNNGNKIKISRQFFKIIFEVVIPPWTFQLYKIKNSLEVGQIVSTIYCLKCEADDVQGGSHLPFHIHNIEAGDIQLESYRHRLVFDEFTGFLKTIADKTTNNEKKLVVDFRAFRSSRINAGMFLFNTNTSKPLENILLTYRLGKDSKTMMIIAGPISTELVSIYGTLLQHTVKIFNILNSPLSSIIKLETKVDYGNSPKNRELEIFLSIQTDISNGNPMELFTDNNGFQFSRRTVNVSRRVESNMYPMTSMAFIEDEENRMTVLTDHCQGVTALQEGQIIITMDRRVLYDDRRGSSEGLADSAMTHHTHYILLENFKVHKYQDDTASQKTGVKLPSLQAIYLAGALNYQLDVYFIDITKGDNCHYAFLPIMRAPLPCDVALINYRAILNRGDRVNHAPNTALITLHRTGYSCSITEDLNLHCSNENIQFKKILRHIKAVYHTNLVGTSEGFPADVLNFPKMEIITLRLHF